MNHPVVQLLRNEETRKRLTMTLGLLMAYRIGFQIPIPGMSPEFLRDQAQNATSTIFGVLSAFSGAALGQTAVFSLGIMPYISASIIFSILVKVSPRLEAVQKEGAAGQKRINQWTRLVTVPIAILQSLLVWFTVFAKEPGIFAGGGDPTLGRMLTVVLGLTAGAIVVMWLGELITEHGVGNGASLIIMAGIIATMPASITQVFERGEDPYDTILTLAVLWLAIVVGVVFIQKGERRITIQYARLTRGRMVYGGQKHYLPLKVNMAGVMPIIFASALFAIPGVLLTSIGWNGLANLLQDADGFVHVAGYLALVFFFCFFWNNLMFQPDDIANNLREHGSFIPGIRPGLKTSEEIGRVLNRITLAGAAFLAVVAVLPNFITARIPGLSGNLAYFLGGTSILIVVGVAMDLVDKLNAQLVMRNYEGFMKGGKGPRGGSSAPGWASKKN